MKTSIFRLLLIVTIAILGQLQPACGADLANRVTPEPAPVVFYRIVPTDVISISVGGESDLNVAGKKVDAKGNINVPLLATDVHVAGLTVKEAQTAIENAYRDGRILRNPQVFVNVEVYAPREVSVTGFVKSPGKVNIPPETVMTLKDAILKCGGFTDTANGKSVRVIRTLPDGNTKLFEKLDIESIVLGKSSAKTEASTFLVEPGDVVYVPERII